MDSAITERPSFPADYSPCDLCGYDHAYDVPHLDAELRSEVLHVHLSDHPVPPYDLLVTGRIP